MNIALVIQKITRIRITKIKWGYCPCCERRTLFIAIGYWLRDDYRCIWCRSIPRQRALMRVLKERVPDYKSIDIHECSPSGVLFKKFKRNVAKYTFSYYWKDKPLGTMVEEVGAYNENLEKMSFQDKKFDVFITQDVLEHIYNPAGALREINRVLKPGGLHVFTVPIYPFMKTRPRIKIEGEKIKKIMPPIYHGDPINANGCLVTWDWGGDIVDYIRRVSGMETEIIEFPNNRLNFKNGIEGDFLWVCVSKRA